MDKYARSLSNLRMGISIREGFSIKYKNWSFMANSLQIFSKSKILLWQNQSKKAPIIKKDNHIFNSVRSILSFALLFMFLKSIMSGVTKGKGQMGKGGGGLSGMF